MILDGASPEAITQAVQAIAAGQVDIGLGRLELCFGGVQVGASGVPGARRSPELGPQPAPSIKTKAKAKAKAKPAPRSRSARR